MEFGRVYDLRHPRYSDLMKQGGVLIKAFIRNRSPNHPDTISCVKLVIRRPSRRIDWFSASRSDVSLVGFSEQHQRKMALGSGTKIAVIFLR